MIDDDYTDDDRYDWDRSDDSQYCEHGSFIGSWWGPDLLCQHCENGTTVAQLDRWAVAGSRRKLNALRKQIVDVFVTSTGLFADLDQQGRDEFATFAKCIGNVLERRTVKHDELVRSVWIARINRRKVTA